MKCFKLFVKFSFVIHKYGCIVGLSLVYLLNAGCTMIEKVVVHIFITIIRIKYKQLYIGNR